MTSSTMLSTPNCALTNPSPNLYNSTSAKHGTLMVVPKFRPHVEEIAVALFFFVFISLAYLVFSNNSPCLFFTLDGSYWRIAHDLQTIPRTPFTQVGADPIQGNFDAYFPPFREYLLPNLLVMPFRHGIAGKAVTYTIYASSMIISVY